MKQYLLTAFAILLSFCLFAQSPNLFSYQAVVRDAQGDLVSNDTVGIQISILQGSSTGTVVFQETHDPVTNDNGLFSLEIGSGSLISGSVSTIDWSNGPYFLQTEIDPNGGSNYSIIGTTQLLTVPYSKYADEAGNVPTNISELNNDAGYLTSEIDGSISNEIQVISFTNDTLYLSDGGQVYLGDYANVFNQDNDSTNEIQAVSFSNDTLFLSNGGHVYLGAYTNEINLDNDSTNEIQAVSFSNDTLLLSNGGHVYLGAYTNEINLDNDSTNEIQAVSFSNDTLFLSNGGQVYLGAYTNEINLDNDSTNEIQAVSFSNDTLFLSNGGQVYLGSYTNEINLDNDSTNEIQNISLSNDSILLSNGGSVKLPAQNLLNGSAAGNTPFWNGSNWISNNSNIFNNGGNVGIGTTTPAHKLDINGNASIRGFLIGNNTLIGTNSAFLRYDGTHVVINASPTTGHIYLNNDHGKNVGVGSGTPNSKLTVTGSESTSSGKDAAIELRNSAAGGNSWFFRSGATGTTTPAAGFSISNNSSYVMMIESNGNTSIGNQSPKAKLDISANSGKTSLLLRNGDVQNGTDNDVQIAMGYNNSSDYSHYIISRHSAGSANGNAIDFYTSDGTQAGVYPTDGVHGMSIYGGKVGIGTKTPSASLEISNTSSTALKIVDGNQAEGKILVSDANGNAEWGNAKIPHGEQFYTTPGTYTWSVPGGVDKVRLTIVGGGGGGGGRGPGAMGGRGGAAGNYVKDTIVNVTPGANISVVVGAGGGQGGDGFSAGPGGTGGTSSFGAISITGGGGGCHNCLFSSQAGSGASGLFGTGGRGGNTNGTCRTPGIGFGAGGGGSAWNCGNGSGAGGLVLVEYYIW